MPSVIANGVLTYYETAGEGEPLLLIAGNGMDHTAFRDQVPSFAAHFRCITYDMRGIGQSDVPESGYTVPEMARDAFALLSALGLSSAHVAGYSLGGAIGMQMAIDEPQRVRSLSLYSTFSHVEPYLRLRYEILVKILLETTPELWAMFTAFSAFGEEYINAHDAEIEKEIALRTGRWRGSDAPSKGGLLGHYRAILGHEVRPRLSEIYCPTWIAVGSSDPVAPPSYAHYLLDRPYRCRKTFPSTPERRTACSISRRNRRRLSAHWRQIRTNNPLERISREIRRRTRAVGVFPDGQSALMLVAARLRHIAGTKWGHAGLHGDGVATRETGAAKPRKAA